MGTRELTLIWHEEHPICLSVALGFNDKPEVAFGKDEVNIFVATFGPYRILTGCDLPRMLRGVADRPFKSELKGEPGRVHQVAQLFV
jgi:hypothetical protein